MHGNRGKYLHIFIDDSGDGGFKFDRGSSSHLVMAACIFRDPKDIEHLKACVDGCAQRNRQVHEFKYNKTKDRIKDCFFECTKTATYDVRAIVMDKSKIYSEKLRAEPAALKSYAIRMLLSRGFGTIYDAKVIIDGQDTKGFGMSDSAYVMRMANSGQDRPVISSVGFGDSKQNRGLQLADMVAGSINRNFRTDRPHDKKKSSHYQIIRPRTYYPSGTVWDFTKNI
ncbi:DUF3800 domain-containing protein [Glutamicibacter sp. AOP5-A2-18]|uniref:DUF3800 domain-containing protein n=1 Tax=Glutamicibacter sp. AOP5-A2-18 TaxID=3457656 RepID=UPI004033D5CC